jgi:hypothetical protein
LVVAVRFSFGVVESGPFFLFIVFVKIEKVGDHVGLDLFCLKCLVVNVLSWLFWMCFLFEPDKSFGVKIVFGVDFGPGGELIFETQRVRNGVAFVIAVGAFVMERVVFECE